MRISKKIVITAICTISIAVLLSILMLVIKNKEEEQRRLEFGEDGLLAETRSSPLWDGHQGEWVFYDSVCQVYNDGRRIYFADDFQSGYTVDLPPVVTQLSEEEIRAIQKVIEDHEFMELSGDMSNYNVCDGGKTSVTVYTADQTNTCGGNNPSGVNERYDAVYASVRGERSEAEITYFMQVRQILKEQYDDRSES